jgi:hypothetical protein
LRAVLFASLQGAAIATQRSMKRDRGHRRRSSRLTRDDEMNGAALPDLAV